MVTFNPRARGGSSLREELAARRKREEQLGRQRIDIPKAKPAAAGGVTGVTRLTAGGMNQTNSGSLGVGSSVSFTNFTVSTPFGTGISVSEGGAGRVTFGAAGFYECRAYLRLAWDAGATVREAEISADFQGADPYPFRKFPLTSQDGLGGGGYELVETFPWGPFYVDAGGWTWFGANWATADPCVLSSMALDVWRVG